MRKKYIIAILLYGLSASAQTEIGLKGGINISNLEGNLRQYDLSNSLSSGYSGVFVAVKITRTMYLQTGITLSRQGGSRSGMQQVPAMVVSTANSANVVDLYADFKSNTMLDYLEIPVLAKVIFGQKLKYYTIFGPYIAFNKNAKIKTNGYSRLFLNKEGTSPYMQKELPYPPVSINYNSNINETIKTINLGVQGGLGVQYPLGPGNIHLEYITNIGFTNIQFHPEKNGKTQTGALALVVGYSVKIK